MKAEIIIGVNNVPASSMWYQQLLGCRSNHGGDTFEILVNDDEQIVLYLHRWGEHDHPTLSNDQTHKGHGLIIYLHVQDLNLIWENAQELGAKVETSLNLNQNSGKEEFAIRDPDGYYLLITA